MRKYGNIDNNQNEIVKKLRETGHSVAITSSMGQGFPDILIGRNGLNLLCEIKTSDKAQLTDDELDWHTEWKGKVVIVHDWEEAVQAMNEQIRKLKGA